MSYLLEVSNLCRSFRSPSGAVIEVLRGIKFRAEGGQLLAVTGASGAGKSTLLQLLGGLDTADAGSIDLDGTAITNASRARLASLRTRAIGFVFQAHRLLLDLTAGENVAMPLLIGRTGWKPARERALEALEQVGLRERARDAVGHLSGGEQQRVALARALVHRPKLVLADEPTGNLDTETGAVIGDLLESYCRNRRAIVVIATHNDQLARRCDRTLHLINGALQ